MKREIFLFWKSPAFYAMTSPPRARRRRFRAGSGQYSRGPRLAAAGAPPPTQIPPAFVPWPAFKAATGTGIAGSVPENPLCYLDRDSFSSNLSRYPSLRMAQGTDLPKSVPPPSDWQEKRDGFPQNPSPKADASAITGTDSSISVPAPAKAAEEGTDGPPPPRASDPSSQFPAG